MMEEKGPLAERGLAAEGRLGDNMDRKHNAALTANAKKLRKEMTREERHLWYDFLRTYPVRFLRQKVIDRYIVDFYCHEARLVVELDGSQHFNDEQEAYDTARTAAIEARGLTVIRFSNDQVMETFYEVCEVIDNKVKESLHRCGGTSL